MWIGQELFERGAIRPACEASAFAQAELAALAVIRYRWVVCRAIRRVGWTAQQTIQTEQALNPGLLAQLLQHRAFARRAQQHRHRQKRLASERLTALALFT